MPLIALPDDPVTAHVVTATLIVPVIRKLMGRTQVIPQLRSARLGHPVAVTPGITTFAHATLNEHGSLWLSAQPDGVDALVWIYRATALVCFEPDEELVPEGTSLDYLLLTH